MSLNYLKENSVGALLDKSAGLSQAKSPAKKFSKKKFFILLAANLTLWLFVSGFYLDISPASIRESIREFARRRGLVVTGVVCNSKMQAAIISDEIHNVGDTIKGYTIVAIYKQGVEFKKGKKKIFKEVASL